MWCGGNAGFAAQKVLGYTSDEARLLHMFLAPYSSSWVFEFALSKEIFSTNPKKFYKQYQLRFSFYCAFVLFKLKSVMFAICFEICFVIRELAKTKRIKALRRFDYVALRKWEKYV